MQAKAPAVTSASAVPAPASPAPRAELLAAFDWHGASENYMPGVTADTVLLASPYWAYSVDLASRKIDEVSRLDGYYPPWAAGAQDGTFYWSAGYSGSGDKSGRLFAYTASTRKLQVVGGPQPHPCSFRVDGDQVTWIDLHTQTVMRARKGEGVARLLGSVPAGWHTDNHCRARIAADDKVLFFAVQNSKPGTKDDAVIRMDLSTGRAKVLVDKETSPSNVELLGDWLLFSTSLPDSIKRIPKNGGPSEVVVSTHRGVHDMVLAGAMLYWVEENYGAPYEIRRWDSSTAKEELVFEGDQRFVYGITVTQTHVVFVTHGNPPGDCREEVDGCGQQPIKRRRCGSPAVQVLRVALPPVS
jgi:hypothetical protein